MKSLTLGANDFPELSEMAKSRIKEGFWSLIKTSEKNGKSRVYVKTEKKTFEISEKGTIKNIINNMDFSELIVARLNFSQ